MFSGIYITSIWDIFMEVVDVNGVSYPCLFKSFKTKIF